MYQKNRQQLAEEVKRRRKAEELEGATFSPSITKKSLLIMSNRDFIPPEDYLIAEGQKSQERQRLAEKYF